VKIELSRIIDSGSPIPPAAELIVIVDDHKKKVHRLSERWLDEFLRLMEEVEHSGAIGEDGSISGPQYVGYCLYEPEKGKEKEVESLYREFKKALIRKTAIKTIILLVVLASLFLLFF